jgi:DNA-directed RNA polymerase subunit RPC12/RpoP
MGNKIYYDCPGCGNEVWAYSGFVGTRCWDCPGTILSGITNATPVISHIKTLGETITNQKTNYKCPSCGAKVWAYGQFAGQSCWNCKGKNPIKAVFDISTGAVSTPSAFVAKEVVKTINPIEHIARAVNITVARDGGHHIHISSSDYNKTIVSVRCRKSDLCKKGWNTLSSAARTILAPVSTILDSNTFWIEHWWFLCELSNGEYITTWKGPEGIIVDKHGTWSSANSCYNNGMNGNNNKCEKTAKGPYSSSTRTVRELVKKIQNTNSYYNLNSSNCQDYAHGLYTWF